MSVHGPRTLSACSSVPPSSQVIVTVTGRPLPLIAMFNVGLRTMTRKLQVLVLPLPSVATTVTMLVVSRWKMVPEGGDDVTVTELHISVAVTDQPTGTLVLQVTMTIFDGQVMTGGVVSWTVTVKEQVAQSPRLSSAVQCTRAAGGGRGENSGGD